MKSAGYAAEYGGSLGGVINAVTKTGGNEFAGSLGLYYTDSSPRLSEIGDVQIRILNHEMTI